MIQCDLQQSDVMAWVSGFRARPNEAVWMVASDWFRERGYDAVADQLQAVTTADAAVAVVADTFWPLCRFQNAYAAAISQELRALSPIGVFHALFPTTSEPNLTCLNSGKYTFQYGSGVRELRLFKPITWRKNRFADPSEAIFTTTVLLRPEKYRWAIPSTMYTRRFDVVTTFWGSADYPAHSYILWPLKPQDVTVIERGRDVTEEVDAELWDGVFDQTCPTDSEMKRDAMRHNWNPGMTPLMFTDPTIRSATGGGR